jgi:hypothetical protein
LIGPMAHARAMKILAFCGARLQACRWLTPVTVVSTFFYALPRIFDGAVESDLSFPPEIQPQSPVPSIAYSFHPPQPKNSSPKLQSRSQGYPSGHLVRGAQSPRGSKRSRLSKLGGTSVHYSGVCRETDDTDSGIPIPAVVVDCWETGSPGRGGSGVRANISGRVALRGWCLVEPPGLKLFSETWNKRCN